ncbi:MAG: aspartyl/asparaginyl beta-hydroxylase domain-containing protein [Rhodanobacteraceae bacterium]
MSRATAASHLSAFLAKPGNARLALLAGEALLDTGEIDLAVATWTLGDDANAMVRRIKDNPNAPAEGRRRSRMADARLCEFLTRLHRHAVDAFEARTGATVERVRRAVWPLTHTSEVEFRTPMQRPVIFYMPELPAAPVEPNDAFAWVPTLETACAEIRREYDSGMQSGVDVRPYVPAETHAADWQDLRGSLDWSAIHLYHDSAATPMLAKFPRTRQALDAVDLARIDGTPMEAFFSRLKPGAHIPPHYGLTNTRVTVHLPLIVPDNCEIRVGRDLHPWREGRIIAFDDSFEHEAWNRSASDRVVLIFEAHHPGLSGQERAAIEHVFTVRQRWLDSRLVRLQGWLTQAGSSIQI